MLSLSADAALCVTQDDGVNENLDDMRSSPLVTRKAKQRERSQATGRRQTCRNVSGETTTTRAAERERSEGRRRRQDDGQNRQEIEINSASESFRSGIVVPRERRGGGKCGCKCDCCCSDDCNDDDETRGGGRSSSIADGEIAEAKGIKR